MSEQVLPILHEGRMVYPIGRREGAQLIAEHLRVQAPKAFLLLGKGQRLFRVYFALDSETFVIAEEASGDHGPYWTKVASVKEYDMVKWLLKRSRSLKPQDATQSDYIVLKATSTEGHY